MFRRQAASHGMAKMLRTLGSDAPSGSATKTSYGAKSAAALRQLLGDLLVGFPLFGSPFGGRRSNYVWIHYIYIYIHIHVYMCITHMYVCVCMYIYIYIYVIIHMMHIHCKFSRGAASTDGVSMLNKKANNKSQSNNNNNQ